MIRVTPADEPKQFNKRVRIPGNEYIGSIPAGQPVDTNRRPYWRRILDDLHHGYSGICAYACHWIPYDVGADTVEHFVPKAINPDLAYEWSNYRLVCSRLNGRKGKHQDVVDPFKVPNGMFEIQFPSLLLKEGEGLDKGDAALASKTIKRLKLNDARCLAMRQRFIEEYVNDQISLGHLTKNAPFLAGEIARQGFSKEDLTAMVHGS